MRLRLAFAGDVMLGRGIDQIQRQSVPPELREPAVSDARDYVRLAERASGPIPRDVDPDYVWGDAAQTLREFAPHAFVLNLETSFTRSDFFDPTKGIHYRAHPDNVRILTSVADPICAVANNHVLDLGEEGLEETLTTLSHASVPHCGAGKNSPQARRPAMVEVADRRDSRRGVLTEECAEHDARTCVVVLSCCVFTSGVAPGWGAGPDRPGVFLLDRLDADAVRSLRDLADRHRSAGDAVVVSIHWGGNWGYAVHPEEVEFAHALVDEGVADVVHGHSSHHARPFEVYRGKPIFYGCGDLINDYEGIRGHETYRPELTSIFLVTYDPDSRGLSDLRIAPFRLSRLRLAEAGPEDSRWIAETMGNVNRLVNGPEVRATPDGLFIA
ncbi:MAG: CapA family protein [Spirochaetota bacterium]